MRFLMDQFPVGKIEQIPHIVRTEPVRNRLTGFERQRNRHLQDRIPECVVEVQNEPRVGAGELPYCRQDVLDVGTQVDQIRQDDVIEIAGEDSLARNKLCHAGLKFSVWNLLAGERDLLFRQIDARHIPIWQEREKTTVTAADFQYARLCRYEKSIITSQQRTIL